MPGIARQGPPAHDAGGPDGRPGTRAGGGAASLAGLSDADLLAASDGASEAFAELYRRHVPALTRFFHRRTGCADAAADLAQETMVTAFERRERYRSHSGSPGCAWLYGIARNKLRAWYRSRGADARARRRLVGRRQVEQAATTESVEQRIDLQWRASALPAAWTELSPRVSAALVLRLAHGLRYASIASELGCTERAARLRVWRGLAQLRAALYHRATTARS